jgi:hypothetical protein
MKKQLTKRAKVRKKEKKENQSGSAAPQVYAISRMNEARTGHSFYGIDRSALVPKKERLFCLVRTLINAMHDPERIMRVEHSVTQPDVVTTTTITILGGPDTSYMQKVTVLEDAIAGLVNRLSPDDRFVVAERLMLRFGVVMDEVKRG